MIDGVNLRRTNPKWNRDELMLAFCRSTTGREWTVYEPISNVERLH